MVFNEKTTIKEIQQFLRDHKIRGSITKVNKHNKQDFIKLIKNYQLDEEKKQREFEERHSSRQEPKDNTPRCSKCGQDLTNVNDDNYMIDEEENLITIWYECPQCNNTEEITDYYM